MPSIAERIRALRGEQSLSAFAEATGLTRSTLGRYEQGVGMPDAEAIAAICRVGRVTADWLIFGTEGKCSMTVEPSPPATCPPCLQPSSSADMEERLRSDMDRYRMEWVRALDDNARLQEEIRVLTEENKRLFRENATLRAQAEAFAREEKPTRKRPRPSRTEKTLSELESPTDIVQYGLPPEHLNRR